MALQITGALGGGGTPAAAAVRQIERAVRQPLPPLPPAPAVRADQVWVPDRLLPAAAGPLYVPGHWEQRVSDHQFFVPPLVACEPVTVRCAPVPAGVRGPADTRREP